MFYLFTIFSNVGILQHVSFQPTPTISTLIEIDIYTSIVVTNIHSLKELPYSTIKSILHHKEYNNLKLNHCKNFHIFLLTIIVQNYYYTPF